MEITAAVDGALGTRSKPLARGAPRDGQASSPLSAHVIGLLSDKTGQPRK